MAEGNNFILDIVASIQKKLSEMQLNSDIKSIEKQLNKLKLQAEIDPNSVKQIAQQLSNIINQKVVVNNIQLDTSKASKVGEQAGQNIGDSLTKRLQSSLNAVKNNIETTIKGFSNQKLNSYDLSKMFNLNRADIDASVIQQVRNLTNELNGLAKEALKTNSDSSWEGIVNKISSLSKVLTQFGSGRDLTSFKESLDVLDYFQNKKIFVGNKAEGLANTGLTVRELNNEFRNLGVTFTTVSEGATKLDTVWTELFNISPNMQNLTAFGDQLNAVVEHLKIAKEALYGDKNLQPLNGHEVNAVLLDWLSNLENVSKKVNVFRGEQEELEKRLAQSSTFTANTVVQNEQRKQEAYKQTTELMAGKDNILQHGNFRTSFDVAGLNNATNSVKEYFEQLYKTVSIKDQLGDDGNLKSFTVTLKNSEGVVEELRYKLNEISNTFEYMGGSINNNGVEKQMNAIDAKAAQLTNTFETLKSKYSDLNASNPIKNEGHISELTKQYIKVEQAIESVKKSDSSTFSSMVSNANAEINALKIMAEQFKHAENVATKMKSTDISSGIAIAKNDLEKFKADAKDFPQIIQTINNLDTAIAKVGDASTLNKFNDDLRVARSELAKIKSEVNTANRNEKVGINVSGLQSKIAGLQRISPEIDRFRTEINGADVTVQSLYNDLEKVNTQSDFSVVNSKFKAFTDAAKSAGIAVTDVGAKTDTVSKKVNVFSSIFSSLKQGIPILAYYTSATYIVMSAIRGIKSIIKNVHELDDALTNISYTMEVSGRQLKEIGESSLQMAKDLNTSASNVLGAVKLYANAKETAQSILAKAKPAIMLSNVTGFSGEESAKYLQTIMNQFDLTQDDLMDISDTIQSVSQNIAHDFSDGIVQINEGISTSGEVARAAGMDLADYASMIGLLVEKTGLAGSQIGNSLKTIITRTTKAGKIMGIDEGEISDAEKSLRSVGIEVRKTDGEFNDFNVTMRELSEQWDSLSDVTKSNISFNLAGTRQINVIQTLLRNWSDYEELVNKANNSTGVTLENQEIYAESLQGKLGELSAVWEKIGDDAISSNFLKGLADAGIAVSSLVEKFGLFKTVIATTAITAFVKNFA